MTTPRPKILHYTKPNVDRIDPEDHALTLGEWLELSGFDRDTRTYKRSEESSSAVGLPG